MALEKISERDEHDFDKIKFEGISDDAKEFIIDILKYRRSAE